MKLSILIALALSITGLTQTVGAATQAENENEQIWNLTGLFKSENDWLKAQKNLKKDIELLKACKGKLSESSKQLQICLERKFATDLKASEIMQWAGLQQASDSLSSKNTEMTGRASDLYSQLRQATSFFSPEISAIKKETIEKFQQENPKLEPYSQYLRETLDQAKHILSTKEEALISAFAPVLRGSSQTYGLLSSADIPWPTIKLSDGDAKIDVAGYSKYRQSANASDRRKAYEAFYDTLKTYERTFGATLSQAIKYRTIDAKLRGYDNALAKALSSENLPEGVYRTLVKEVNNSLPTLHRYLKLRKQMLGLKEQKYSDVYPSVVDSKVKYPLEKTRQMTLAAVEPLGQDYVNKLTSATQQPWMDVYPRKGKQPGAFMSGSAYNLNPFVFLNHQDDYSSASTYAHEWGHAMHSIYSNQTQPYAKAGYSIFVAEIAAIVNEALMVEKAIKEAKNDDEKLFYLGYSLEFIRGTYFRQTQFSEFELKLHELVESGESLSGQKISQVYGDIARKYYGHKKGVMDVEERFFTEWAFVPHFYGGFYVYNYSTSIAAAYYFAEKILSGDQQTLDKYLTMLKAGGSQYPHEILLEAGLDMTRPDAHRALDKKANLILDEMEGILRTQGRIPRT